jgi:hypothetical protein
MKHPDAYVVFHPQPFVRRAIYACRGAELISAPMIADTIIRHRPALKAERAMLEEIAQQELSRRWGI